MSDRLPDVPRPIAAIAERAGIPAAGWEPYGLYKAKLAEDFLAEHRDRRRGRLILVTATSPTKAGEGKTTTSIGLGDALSRLGRNTMIALRQPSLGPVFGQKGGATGGGRAQIVPAIDINLHFTGDFHAVSAAHNLLAALVDNHLHWGNALGIDPRRVFWPRVVDMNDRALRDIAIGRGDGVPRETRFDITAASEVMAILCLAEGLADAERRLGRIAVAEGGDGRLVTAADLKAAPAMTALLRDALRPNLVQTLEGTPVFVHGGPFANIAHGCNSVAATRAALGLADYVVTEAGFGADLGAEKFFDIKCRQSGLAPDIAVLVATVRSLKLHGGVGDKELATENLSAVRAGFANLARHAENLAKFGVPVVAAINRFPSDTEAELAVVERLCAEAGLVSARCEHFTHGGAGAEALAHAVLETLAARPAAFRPLYGDDIPLAAKIATVAREIYRADRVEFAPAAAEGLALFEAGGFGRLPVCIAKTQYSFAADAALAGAPTGHVLPVREVRLAAGAGFVVAVAGDIMTMPGLPRHPAAERIAVSHDGAISGIG